MHTASRFAPGFVEAYAAGVRLGQALILHDYAVTSRDGVKPKYVRSALGRLTKALGSLTRSGCGFTFSAVRAKKTLKSAYEKWVAWQKSRTEPDDGGSPLRQALETCRAHLDDMFMRIASYVDVSRILMTENAVCFPIDQSVWTWFRLGLAITRCVYSDEKAGLQWDDQPALESLLAALKINLNDVYFGVAMYRTAVKGYPYPAQLVHWEIVDFALDELRRTGAARLSAEAPAFQSASDEADVRFDPNGEYVYWYGTEFEFTGPQGAVFIALWKALQDRIPYMSSAALLQAAGGEGNRLRDVFKGNGNEIHPAWGTLIVPFGTRRGRYCLKRPDNVKSD
jgi:hypothetical protein